MSSVLPSGTRNRSISWNSGAPAAAMPGRSAVIAVAEAQPGVALDHLDTIERPAPDVARSFEGIGAVGQGQNRLLPLREASLQSGELRLAEQAQSDRGNAHRGKIEVDESITRVG